MLEQSKQDNAKLESTAKVKGYLNIAKKAGYVIYGGDTLASYTKKLYLVLASKNSGKTTQKIAARLKTLGHKVLLVDDLESLTGENCKIIGIKNKGLAEAIEKLLEKQNY